MRKIVLLIVVSFVVLFCNAETGPASNYAGGDGTEANPYQIANLAQLRKLSETAGDWSKYFKLTANINASETCMWNISDSDTLGFSPIGTDVIYFTGGFNGNGYTIDSIYINRNAASNIGFFTQIKDAEIKNLGITNCTVIGTYYLGGLSGQIDSSVVENCYVTGSIRGKGNVTGGLAADINGSQINKCYTKCTVSNYINIGGIAGIVRNGSVIKNCFASGDAISGRFRGGLIGQFSSSSIENCYVSGNVNNNSQEYCGTFIGKRKSGTIKNCYYDLDRNPVLGPINDSIFTDIIALKSVEFSNEENFENWDFDTIWAIAVLEGVDSLPRPIFRQGFDYTVIVKTFSGQVFEGKQYQTVNSGENADTLFSGGDNSERKFHFWLKSDSTLLSENDTLILTNITSDTSVFIVYETLPKQPDGYSSDGGIISTVAELRWLSETSDAWDEDWQLANNIDAYETKYWNDSVGFSKIGTNSNRFTGTFNGKRNCINKLHIKNTEEYSGMFGFIKEAEIKDLGLTNCQVSAGGYTGALIAAASESSITNCYVTGNVKGTSEVLGGMIGITGANSTVKACYSNCTVSGDTTIGGLIGAHGENSTVEDCYALGNILSGIKRGGLVGNLFGGTIKNCYAATIVNNNSEENVGSFVGTAIFSNTITNCYYDSTRNVKLNSIGNSTDDGVSALLSNEFSEESNFTDWDFVTVWHIDSVPEIDTVKRPYLRWQLDSYVIEFKLGSGGDSLIGDSVQYLLAGENSGEITAIAKEGYNFKEWQDGNGTFISTNNPLTLTNVTSDTILYAVFELETSYFESTAEKSEILIIPNPTTGLVTIPLQSTRGNANLSIYSITGKVVYSNTEFKGGSVDLSDLQAGIYIVKINSQGTVSTSKLIKE